MSVRVIVDGWNPGLRKVSLTSLLRRYGFGLYTSKASVDGLLDGFSFYVDFLSDDSANKFSKFAEALGAKTKTVNI